MKAFLRAFLGWLDRKFPDKVLVTPADYQALHAGQATHTGQLSALEVRIKALETQMSNINLAIGFSAPKLGMLER